MQQLQIPPLTDGEVYLCGFVDANGDVEHTVLLPGDERATWKKALEWARSIGGDLPTRIELSVAYANHRALFEQAAYWSKEEDKDEAGRAWFQFFSNGHQSYGDTDYEFRARAVRRLVFE